MLTRMFVPTDGKPAPLYMQAFWVTVLLMVIGHAAGWVLSRSPFAWKRAWTMTPAPVLGVVGATVLVFAIVLAPGRPRRLSTSSFDGGPASDGRSRVRDLAAAGRRGPWAGPFTEPTPPLAAAPPGLGFLAAGRVRGQSTGAGRLRRSGGPARPRPGVLPARRDAPRPDGREARPADGDVPRQLPRRPRVRRPAAGRGHDAVVFNFGVPGSGPYFQTIMMDRLRKDGVRTDVLFLEVLHSFYNAAGVRSLDGSLLDGARLSYGEAVGLFDYSPKSQRGPLRRWALARALPVYRHQAELRDRIGLDVFRPGEGPTPPFAPIDPLGYREREIEPETWAELTAARPQAVRPVLHGLPVRSGRLGPAGRDHRPGAGRPEPRSSSVLMPEGSRVPRTCPLPRSGPGWTTSIRPTAERSRESRSLTPVAGWTTRPFTTSTTCCRTGRGRSPTASGPRPWSRLCGGREMRVAAR